MTTHAERVALQAARERPARDTSSLDLGGRHYRLIRVSPIDLEWFDGTDQRVKPELSTALTEVALLRVRIACATPLDVRRADALAAALDLIDVGESRALAADGPVTHFRNELDDGEWRKLWLALDALRDTQ
jgi:hypothetical protein